MGSDFEKRLKDAIERGASRAKARDDQARKERMSAAELKASHGECRLILSEHIEACVERLLGFFPGFQFETIYGEKGWGAACSRDDFVPGGSTRPGSRKSHYSRLEMVVRPLSSLNVLELTAKGTIRNKELFNRTQFKKIQEVEIEDFMKLVDTWVIEYAEMFAAKN